MPEADGLEYPGRKDLIGLARGLYRFLRTDRAGDRYRQRGTGIRGYGIVAPEYGKNDFEGIENPGIK